MTRAPRMQARAIDKGPLRVLLTPKHNGSDLYGAAREVSKFGAAIGDFVIVCSADETVGGDVVERTRYGLVVQLKAELAAREVTVIKTALGAPTTTTQPGAGPCTPTSRATRR